MSTMSDAFLTPRQAIDLIATLGYEVRVDKDEFRLSWGDVQTAKVEVICSDGRVMERLARQYVVKLGIRIFDGTDKVVDRRVGSVTFNGGYDRALLSFDFSTDLTRPGPHKTEIDLVVDELIWFGRPTVVWAFIEDSEKFVDVKKLCQELSVEELAQKADQYFKTYFNSEWMYRKPYSFKDIQHSWAQVQVLLRGLQMTAGMSVVDFGAGTGWISRTLSNLGLHVYSLDVSSSALEMSRRARDAEVVLYPRPPIEYVRFNGRHIPLPDESIDRVLCNDALHHVPNVEEVIREMGRVLKKGGIAGFCEPGPRHSLEPRSQEEMRAHRVLENDIDLPAIDRIARQNGFVRTAVSLFSPYPVQLSFTEWESLGPESVAMKRYAAQALARMKIVSIFFLHK